MDHLPYRLCIYKPLFYSTGVDWPHVLWGFAAGLSSLWEFLHKCLTTMTSTTRLKREISILFTMKSLHSYALHCRITEDYDSPAVFVLQLPTLALIQIYVNISCLQTKWNSISSNSYFVMKTTYASVLLEPYINYLSGQQTVPCFNSQQSMWGRGGGRWWCQPGLLWAGQYCCSVQGVMVNTVVLQCRHI